MPKFRVEIDKQQFLTIEEIEAENEEEALEMAMLMVDVNHNDIIYDDQEPETEFEVFRLRA